MSALPAAHVYHRPLDPNGQDSLAKLVRWIRPDSQVLDLGAGPGVLGRYLTETLNCVVDGAEYNPAAVTEAAPWYRHLECVDLERIALADCFAGRRYDFIVCADILEHLRQPGELLAQLAGLLAPGGHVLASVPNVAYAGLIADLLAGEFRYRPEGLLDETHLRFFTLASLNRLLEEHGLRAVAMDIALRDLRDSEFTERCLDALPPALTRGLLGRPEALVYQFIVAARVAREADGIAPPTLVCPPPELRFACQLFWRPPGADYQECESSVAWGRLGEARQKIMLPVPAGRVPLAALRLDLADRPGVLRLHALALHDSAGRPLWIWDGRRASLAAWPGQQLACADLEPLMAGVTMLLTGDDPVMELPASAPTLAGLRDGGELRLELSWPMSLDYLALVQDCVPRRDAAALAARIAELEHALAARVTELEGSRAALETHGIALEREAAARTARQTELEQQMERLQAQLHRQAAELDALRRSWRERLWAGLRRWRG